MPTLKKALVVAALALTTGAAAAHAQQPGAQATQVMASRADLEALAIQLEQAAQSGTYTSNQRALFRSQALRVRSRLTNGDFQVGDRIYLQVFGETTLTDTFTVRGGREILLPAIGPVPLAGVLRTELTEYLSQRLMQFVRNPQVRAQALIRVGIYGGVARQGYYTVPVDITVDEAFRLAGGLSPMAEMDNITVERGQDILYDGTYLEQVIAEGRTLDDLSIQAGDRFRIPQTNPNQNVFRSLQTVQILFSFAITVISIVSIFSN
jgi:protein involved in polysaccharide export with SLBB domain